MPVISGANLTWIESRETPPVHHLSVCPRTAVYQGTISGVTFSTDGGLIEFTYTGGSGTAADVRDGMTVDFGSTPGGYDKGRARLKDLLTGSSTVKVGNIPIADVPFDLGDYFTIRDEFFFHEVKPRQVDLDDDEGFIEYQDYNILYTDENEDIQPIANITGSASDFDMPRLADYVDDGLGYRVLTLDASQSIVMADGASSFTVFWRLKDCTLDSGTTSSNQITIRVPTGFRHIQLDVTDNLGNVTQRFLPLWTHTKAGADAPLSNVQITKREQGEGWELRARFVDREDDSVDETVIPKQTMFYFWEEEDRDQYIGQAIGWSTSEVNTLQQDRGAVEFDIKGAHWWLNRIKGIPQTVINKQAATSEWYEFHTLTMNRLIHYILRRYTTFFSICNFFPFAVDPELPDYPIPSGQVWGQVTKLVQHNQMGWARIDANGGLHLRFKESYKSDTERGNTPIAAALQAKHWSYDAPPTVVEDYTKRVGYVLGEGESVDAGVVSYYKSNAPAATPGSAPGTTQLPKQYLGTVSPQVMLNRLVGHHYAAVNTPWKPQQLQMLGNWDFIDLAHGDKMTRTYSQGTPRGYSESAVEHTIEKISIVYGQDSRKRKQIVWVVDRVTDGYQGIGISRTRSPRSTPRGSKAFVDENGFLLLTDDFDTTVDAGGPTYTKTDLSLTGTVVQFMADPTSAGYDSDGGQIDGVIVTTERIYTIEDIWDEHGGRTVTSRLTFRQAESLRSLDISAGVQHRAVVTTSYDDGCYETHSSNLTSWSTEAQYGSGTAQDTTGGGGGGQSFDFDAASYSADWDNDVNAIGSWGASQRFGTTNAFKQAISNPSLNRQALYREISFSPSIAVDSFDITYDWYARESVAALWRAEVEIDHSGGTYTRSLPLHSTSGAGTDGWESLSDSVSSLGLTGVTQIRLDFETGDLNPNFPDQQIDLKTFDYTTTGGPGTPATTNNPPGCFVSSINIGKVYTSGAISSGASTDGFESSDNGATMTQLTQPDIQPDENLMGDIGVLQAGNFDDETTLYHGKVSSDARKLILVPFTGTTFTDISPSYDPGSGSETYGPWLSRGQCEVHPLDGNLAVFMLTNADKSLVGMWTTRDGGNILDKRYDPIADGVDGRYHRAFWVGDATLQVYLLGTKGLIGFSPDMGVTFESKVGNIASLGGIGEIIGYAERYGVR